MRPSLEDLRNVNAPAWLWDAERRRIVWANDTGLTVFGCKSLFELVDRPFDSRDPGVERLAGLAADLSWGERRSALLHLPSTGSPVPFHCEIYVHALADGRPGLLAIAQMEAHAPNDAAVAEQPPKRGNSGPEDSSLASKVEAFAMLKRTLTDNLRAPSPNTAAPLPVQPEPAGENIEPPAQAVPPLPIRQVLDRAALGIIVCRNGLALYATARLAGMLGHASTAAVLADRNFLHELHAVPSGMSLVVDLQRPGVSALLVSRQPLPWHNGPAEQFILKPLTAGPGDEKKVERERAAAPPAPASDAHERKPGGQPPRGKRNAPSAKTATDAPAQADEARAEARDTVALDELKAILDVASDGIITLAKNGEVLGFSAAAEAIFGMSAAQAAGKPLGELLHPDYRRQFRDYLAGLRGAGLAAVFNDGMEMRAINAQGGDVPLFMTIGRLQSPRSKASFCAVVRDLTSWKRTERELLAARDSAIAASRQKSDFLARISHELRTPLNAILGFSEVMRTQRFGAMGNDKYLAYANDIHASGGHLLSVVSDLLDLSRVEAGKLELDFMAVGLEEVADYAFNLLGQEASAAGVVLRKSLPADLPRVVGDQKTLRQVMINLVSNGIKYSDAGGEVLVSAGLNGDGALTVRVKDTGIGMSGAELEEVLEPYGRIENAARQRPGTGLGLPLTKSLVEANRAKFTIASAEGRGTLVEIQFPGPRVLAG